MKHIRKFNEAIIDYKSDSIKSFYDECIGGIQNRVISIKEVKEIGDRCGVEVVDYETFYKELPEVERRTAPPMTALFAIVNPNTNKPRVVCNKQNLRKEDLDFIYHMLKHENIHIGQKSRRGDKGQGEGMDPLDRKAYFSNKDEIMAFSQSISDMIMDSNPKDINDAISKLKTINLWTVIKSVVDKDVLKRYKKYIYLYLQQELNN